MPKEAVASVLQEYVPAGMVREGNVFGTARETLASLPLLSLASGNGKSQARNADSMPAITPARTAIAMTTNGVAPQFGVTSSDQVETPANEIVSFSGARFFASVEQPSNELNSQFGASSSSHAKIIELQSQPIEQADPGERISALQLTTESSPGKPVSTPPEEELPATGQEKTVPLQTVQKQAEPLDKRVAPGVPRLVVEAAVQQPQHEQTRSGRGFVLGRSLASATSAPALKPSKGISTEISSFRPANVVPTANVKADTVPMSNTSRPSKGLAPAQLQPLARQSHGAYSSPSLMTSVASTASLPAAKIEPTPVATASELATIAARPSFTSADSAPAVVSFRPSPKPAVTPVSSEPTQSAAVITPTQSAPTPVAPAIVAATAQAPLTPAPFTTARDVATAPLVGTGAGSVANLQPATAMTQDATSPHVEAPSPSLMEYVAAAPAFITAPKTPLAPSAQNFAFTLRMLGLTDVAKSVSAVTARPEPISDPKAASVSKEIPAAISSGPTTPTAAPAAPRDPAIASQRASDMHQPAQSATRGPSTTTQRQTELSAAELNKPSSALQKSADLPEVVHAAAVTSRWTGAPTFESSVLASPDARPEVAEPVRQDLPIAAQEIHLQAPELPKTSASSEILLHLAGNDQTSAAIRVTDRAGSVNVSVHASDPVLRESLRTNLGELSAQLNNQGWKADSMRTATVTAHSDSQSDSNAEGQRGSQHQQSSGGDRQPQRDRRSNGQWQQELYQQIQGGAHPGGNA